MILIQDVPCSISKQFTELGLRVLEAQTMTEKLTQLWDWSQFDPQTTLLVFPGNGASIVRSYLPMEWLRRWSWLGVHAKRYWQPGSDPQVIVTRIAPQMLLGVKAVVVIDDVISSGKTITRLRNLNQPWIPGAKWHALTWIAQRSAKAKGFVSLEAVEVVGEKNKKTPINSLSTLLENPAIAQSYAQRNFPDPEKFLGVLAALG